jgi:DNA polymerase III sliding clamp (beta) subunit (PCNA family)
MKKIKEENSALKKVSGMGDMSGYDAMSQKIVNLNEKQDDTPINIVKFPERLDRIAEFHITDSYLTKDDFKRILFVSKALSKNEKQIKSAAYKSFIHVEIEDDKKLVVATDGARLHVAEVNLDLIPGNYTIRVSKKLIALAGPIENDDSRYPNWRKVVPKNLTERMIIDFNKTSLSKKDIDGIVEMSRTMYRLIKETNKIINLCHLDDLMKNTWSVRVDDKMANSPVVFENSIEKSVFALIMPINPE